MPKHHYILLLRGINVGGNHKVPMASLREELEKMNFTNVGTILNSGNVIFCSDVRPSTDQIEKRLHSAFKFPIPVVLIAASEFSEMAHEDRFSGVTVSKNTRLYVSFLKDIPTAVEATSLSIEGFEVIGMHQRFIFSVLDISTNSSAKGMQLLEKMFVNEITTRNWNTVLKLAAKIARP